MSTKHSIAAEKFNQDSGRVTRHDQTFWSVRSKRDGLAYQLEEWEQLRESANLIKKHTITHLADYLEQFEANAKKNGVHVHWAKDADEYNDIVMEIMRQHNVKKVVKSKSMLTEECHLNDNLIKHGIDVVETDLGERILQLMEIPPSHIVMPAIHVTREEVAACFREKGIIEKHGAHAAEGLLKEGEDWRTSSDPTYLTRAARYHLRDNFMEADCGMTGGNFGIAETGDIVVCTNEGNADMSTSIPKLHIVSIGLEKIIPNYKAMGVFQRLLARHGTGQATTVYTSHFRKARPGAEMHIILVDNGRSSILGNIEHWQTLKCMRCGACMEANYHNCSACSLCMSCDNVCPVKVDLSTQIYKWRQELDSMGHADTLKKMTSAGMQTLFEHPSLYTTALKFAPLANHVPAFMTNIKANTWCYGHTMPEFAKESFHTLWKKGKVK